MGASTTPPSAGTFSTPSAVIRKTRAHEHGARAAHDVVEPGAVAGSESRFGPGSASAGVDAIFERVRIGPGARLGARDGLADRVLHVALQGGELVVAELGVRRASRPRSGARGPARPSARTSPAARRPRRRARRGPPCAASSARAPSARRPSARARSPYAPRDRPRARRCRPRRRPRSRRRARARPATRRRS